MAYARFYGPGNPAVPQCDVYVYMADELTCSNCRTVYEDRGAPWRLGLESDFRAASTAAMAAHLKDHVARSHHVPDLDGIIAEMEADDAENFG